MPAFRGASWALQSTGETPVPPIPQKTLFFNPLRLFPLIFFAPLPGLFAAEFPDDALPAVFAVQAGIGAGPAGIQTFLAVRQFHLLTDYAGLPFRVKTALHRLATPLFSLYRTYIIIPDVRGGGAGSLPSLSMSIWLFQKDKPHAKTQRRKVRRTHIEKGLDTARQLERSLKKELFIF